MTVELRMFTKKPTNPQPGDWFNDPETGTVYIWAGTWWPMLSNVPEFQGTYEIIEEP